MNINVKILAVAISCAVVLPSWADIQFNGFASIVAGMTLDDDESYFGYDDQIDFKNESIFALQIRSDLSEGLSATAQIVARGSESFDAEFAWAYLSYEINDYWKVDAGRIRIPFYMHSEYVDVGYAYHWIRPPQGVYSIPFNDYEGLGLVNTSTIGDFDSALQLQYANTSDDDFLPSGDGSPPSAFSWEDVLGITWTLSYEEWNIRFGHFSGTIYYDSANIAGLAQLSLDTGLSQEVANSILLQDDTGAFTTVGITWDNGDVFVMSEFAQIEFDPSAFGDQDSFYISVGKRFDEITFHATWGYDENTPSFDNIAALVPISHPLFGAITGLANNGTEDSTNYSLGLKYDFHPSASFKIEYSNFDDDVNDLTDASVISAAVDLVF